MKQKLIEELNLCLELWEKQKHCEFGGCTKCEECGVPYLLYKLITGTVLDGKGMKRLTLEEWKTKLDEIKK